MTSWLMVPAQLKPNLNETPFYLSRYTLGIKNQIKDAKTAVKRFISLAVSDRPMQFCIWTPSIGYCSNVAVF